MNRRFLAIPTLVALLLAGAASANEEPLKVLSEQGLSLNKIRFAWQGRQSLAEYDLRFERTEPGQDRLGTFERSHYRLVSDEAPALQAEFSLKRYADGLTTASLDYQGPRLLDKNSIQVAMQLPKFRRGLAIQRYDPYWTGPSFSSDYRLLPDSNSMVLWQRLRDQNFQLLVPLAGDGLVGEVGKQNLYFGVTMSSQAPNAPRHVPIFAYATADSPYRLADRVYEAAFNEGKFYGRLRKEKPFPEIFRQFGWCSWNAYYQQVSEKDLLASVRSQRKKGIPLGFVLIDDGWLTVKDWKLAGFDADPGKFPQGLRGAVDQLKALGVKHVGVWHTLQGYWKGLYPQTFAHSFAGLDGKYLPDPRSEGFFLAWYQHLREAGLDFTKVDGQANLAGFTNGLLPLFQAGEGIQRGLQEAANQHFNHQGVSLINCMEMTLENAYNWRFSNLARTGNDFFPDEPWTAKEHVFENAYNSFWLSQFAYPDYDMFQSYRPEAEYHAIARAISGGPIYTADELGKENPTLLKRLMFPDGRLLMLDGPGQVTRDTLLVDTSLQPVPLKLFGTISRPGFSAGMVAAFNVDKSAARVQGTLGQADVEGLKGTVAVYQRSTGKATLLEPKATLPIALGEYGADLFTLVPVSHDLAAFGLLDKYLGPAAITRQTWDEQGVEVGLRGAGDFGAWLKEKPSGVLLDGKRLPASAYAYADGLLKVPASSFPKKNGERALRILLRR